MSQAGSVGIQRIAAVVCYVRDLERARRFFTDKLDFEEIGASSEAFERSAGERGVLVRAGDCVLGLVAPLGEAGEARRFLARHPEGVGTLVFEVEDAARAFAIVEARGGTPITDVVRFEDDRGALATFAIATPLGDTTFRFVERRGDASPLPGFVAHAEPRGGKNRFGFGAVDHVTANYRTMTPALLWMEHVLGLERTWNVCIHTGDAAAAGSGLRSTVMSDPRSGVKIASNEPCRPRFEASQIALFTEQHRGDGVQHAAITTGDIVSAVRGLRDRGVGFRPTPRAYYDRLPSHLARLGVGAIGHSVETLRELGILVDGEAPGRYLLQIFLHDQAGHLRDRDAGPFFLEIIQREGDTGFGAGNFRALFESIEREQDVR